MVNTQISFLHSPYCDDILLSCFHHEWVNLECVCFCGVVCDTNFITDTPLTNCDMPVRFYLIMTSKNISQKTRLRFVLILFSLYSQRTVRERHILMKQLNTPLICFTKTCTDHFPLNRHRPVEGGGGCYLFN